MEKYNNIVKIEKVKKCLEQGDTLTALSIGKTINRKKLKNMSDLSILAEAYFQNKQYEEAKEIFESIYEKSKSRRVLAQLIHLSIHLNDGNAAKQYLEEFKRIAPRDFYRHIFQYNIDKMLGMDIHILIEDLERLKEEEHMENWAYELAKLYHKAGMKEKCIEECSNIILWFGNGVYVDKARALRAYYQGELDLKEFEGKNQEKKEQDIASQIRAILKEQEESSAKYETNEDTEILCENEIAEDSEEAKEYEETESVSIETENVEYAQEEAELIMEEVSEVVELLVEDASEETELIGKESDQIVEEASEETPEEVSEGEEQFVSESSNEDATEETLQGFAEKMEENTELKKTVEIRTENPEKELSMEALQILEQANICLESIFHAYLYLDSVKKQLLRSVERIVVKKEKHVNMIITGEGKTGKTDLAKSISKLMHQLGMVRSSKIAIVNAENLNKIDLIQKANQLNGCMLIIENAGVLSSESVSRILELEESDSEYAAIVLEGSRESINQLLRAHNELNGVFNNRIHLNKYSIEEYLVFAICYAREREYEIDEEAYELLRDIIGKKSKEKREYTLEHVFSFMHDILQSAERRSTKELLHMTQTGKYSDHDLMVIRKQDVLMP